MIKHSIEENCAGITISRNFLIGPRVSRIISFKHVKLKLFVLKYCQTIETKTKEETEI